ncbi:MAG: type IV pilin N-terminal domain-containing protein [Methanomicrobiaceae archaeon]|nr:type IV pilin N-terminal domain-containing protein [Methanomicrobiaceae archaeon]
MLYINDKKSFSEREPGVSEVIGTILIVALVVILVAIASIMVFGIDVPLFNPELVYVDVSKTDTGGTEYIVITHQCGESVELMKNGGCIIKVISPASEILSLTNADGGPITWDDGVAVYIYRTAGGNYEISASRPAVAIAVFDSGTWGVVGVDSKNDIIMFEDSLDF